MSLEQVKALLVLQTRAAVRVAAHNALGMGPWSDVYYTMGLDSAQPWPWQSRLVHLRTIALDGSTGRAQALEAPSRVDTYVESGGMRITRKELLIIMHAADYGTNTRCTSGI
jgi:hypothetical protein